MSKWQYDALFVVMVVGAIFLLFAKTLGFEIEPTALTGYGALTTYVLTQRGTWTKADTAAKKKQADALDPGADDEEEPS